MDSIRNLVQISTKMRLERPLNRNLVQISTKMRTKVSPMSAIPVPARGIRILEKCLLLIEKKQAI